MRLELAKYPVKDVRFGIKTAYRDGLLEINKAELIDLIKEDKRIASADVEIAFPGEHTRIVNLRDVIEPRVKISGPSCVFPGVMGPPETAGEGHTNTMPGVIVTTSAVYKPTILDGLDSESPALLDMWGPAANLTPFSKLICIVPIFSLVDDVTEIEAHAAMQLAGFKFARRLAECTAGLKEESKEVFELPPVDPALPKVVYVLTSCTTQGLNSHTGTAYYGLPLRETLATLMHPNELIDGAVTTDVRRGNGAFAYAWTWMNNPVVLRLLREHGKRVNFGGVILQRTRFPFDFGKQVAATCSSQMARFIGAQCAIVTRLSPGGNNFVDVMLTVGALEKKGIKTVFLTPEWGGTKGTELPLPFYAREAVSMVSSGSQERGITLPAPEKVIGVPKGGLTRMYVNEKPFSPFTELTRDSWRDILGGIDWVGAMDIACREY